MKNKHMDLRPYGIDPSKGRSYESITYVLALVYNQLQTQVEKQLAPYHVNAVQFNILMLAAYANEGNGLSQVEIAKHLIASASHITKLVERSVQAGWLMRQTNPRSRRENIIRITPKGQRFIDSVWPGYENLVRNLTEKIPAQHRALLAKILADWFCSLQQEK